MNKLIDYLTRTTKKFELRTVINAEGTGFLEVSLGGSALVFKIDLLGPEVGDLTCEHAISIIKAYENKRELADGEAPF